MKQLTNKNKLKKEMMNPYTLQCLMSHMLLEFANNSQTKKTTKKPTKK